MRCMKRTKKQNEAEFGRFFLKNVEFIFLSVATTKLIYLKEVVVMFALS